MSRPHIARTTIELAGHARAAALRLSIVQTISGARRDNGLDARQLARSAGVSLDSILELEAAQRDPGLEVLCRVGEALGTPLQVWFAPGTGPAIHDRHQAAALGPLARALHGDWKATLEVEVGGAVHGWIDAVLDRRRSRECVAVESESGLYRIEQQLRWAGAKAEALDLQRRESGQAVGVSRMLLLRSTSATRSVAATYADVLTTAYPAPMVDAVAALTGTAAWPGPAVVWCHVDRAGGRLLERPPRGIRAGA